MSCLRLNTSLSRSTLLKSPSARTLTTSRRLLEDPAKTTKVTSNHKAPPVPRSRATNSQLPIAPLVAIFLVGSGAFYYIVKSREGQGRPGGHQPTPERAPDSKEQWPRNTASDQTLSRR